MPKRKSPQRPPLRALNEICPWLLLPFFGLLRHRGNRRDVGFLDGSIERREILGLDFVPSRQLRFEARIELVVDDVGRGGRTGVRAFHSSLQSYELVGHLNREIQRIFSGRRFRLDDFFFNGVHFFDERVARVEDRLCARVRGETLLQSVELAANTAKLVHSFIAGTNATAYAQSKLLLFLEVGLSCGYARIFGELEAGV